jgi:hypothetical protein
MIVCAQIGQTSAYLKIYLFIIHNLGLLPSSSSRWGVGEGVIQLLKIFCVSHGVPAT